MKELETLKEIIKYLNCSTSYISQRSDYSKGYKAGIDVAKGIIEDIIKENCPELL